MKAKIRNGRFDNGFETICHQEPCLVIRPVKAWKQSPGGGFGGAGFTKE